MARTRRRGLYRRRRIDPAFLIVAAFATALFGMWLIARRDVRSPSKKSEMTMAQARAFNASVPIVAGGLRPAAPFHFHGTPAAREQAAQCLATAALYEAGAEEAGQKAVIQVVLNRVRLPQYPRTICGVVYQGSTLATGCQFSFTCDGSQARRPEARGWEGARAEAKRALGGYVFPAVGRATHYHADWMVPYWIGSLDKIAKVRTHIFYRPKSQPPAAAANFAIVG